MRTNILVLLLLGSVITIDSGCKSMAKAAAKHWTKKQIKNFKKSCVEKAATKFNSEKASDFCNCATDILMEKVPDANKAMEMNLTDLIREAGKCAFQ